MTKINRFKFACAALAALLAAMTIMGIARSEQLTEAQTRINAVYQKAFYETCELTESISVCYRKLLVAGDQAERQELLSQICRDAQGAAGDLALLPVGQDTVSATIKFINQAEDFAETLSVKTAAGEEISESEYETMASLSDSAAQFSISMGDLMTRFERGDVRLSADDIAADPEGLHPITSVATDYPALLYDGPFSDGETSGEYEWIGQMDEVSAQEAEKNLRAYIPCDAVSYVGTSRPEVDAYEFSVRSGDYNLSAIVTVRGGQILYLLPENTFDESKLTENELIGKAQAFLIARGYGDMHMSYFSAFAGVMTINFAAMEGDVLLYPDLIKVQISMRDGMIIGVDAKGYLKNHHNRQIGSARLTPEEAMERIGSRLTAQSARLCVIPKNQSEILCYEIAASDGEDQFLAYIDAQSGAERELMQVLDADSGKLVM